MDSNHRIERNLSDRIRIGGHPFKRRKRRAVASYFVLLGLSNVNAFVSFSFPFSRVSFQRFPHQRDGRLLLRTNADASGEDGKGGDTDGKSYRISSEQLERLKESVDIVSVIESYGLSGFQRQGDHRAKALCPFHNDHNPSLSIDNQRGIFKCFSCGAGGDVFHFVREYGALKGEAMTFYQAVRHVAQEFGDPDLQLDFASSSAMSRLSDEDRKALSEKKERLLLANAAAAAFYGKCLITMPAAGVARFHVQARGLSPTTVHAFAMGYAPDAYFRVKGEWGKGSLVHYLRNLGFKPSEIIEAGLATRTRAFEQKGANKGSVVATNSGSNATISQIEENDDDYDTLIDRFRNRLVVPIFDGKGANVLGFGGRILPPEENDDSGCESPKYINSPESPVFHKKDVIFSQYSASKAVAEMRNTAANGESGPGRGSVVIVEGYMDAIALWEAGVREVVASMGTALTMEQLTNAAKTAGTRGGRVVICLDSDEAGVNAIERLCTGSLLMKTADTYVVEILVATLPSGVKDPAEYVESGNKKGRSGLGQQFRKEVLDTAKDWTTWYLDRLLSGYDERALRGMAGSFANICDRVSDFLSKFSHPAERTKRAHDVAGSLADVISGGSDSGQVSHALRIQLESDLVNMVARKAGARESIERRLESVEGASSEVISQKLRKMTEGNGVSSSDDSSRLSARALNVLKKAALPMQSDGKTSSAEIITSRRRTSSRGSGSVGSRRGERRGMRRSSTTKISQPPLIPHFCGFAFENQSDADWLNIPRDKWRRKKKHLTLGTKVDGEKMSKAMAARMGDDYIPGLVLDDPVYFNSNQYNGDKFLTEDAVDAGYRTVGEVARDASILEHGIATLVRQNADVLVNAAEERLLKNLVKFDRARTAMIHSLATGDATGSRTSIEWSTPERAWLFICLVVRPETVPDDLLVDGRMQDLRKYLADLPDSPPGAFDSLAPSPSVGTVIFALETDIRVVESTADPGTADVEVLIENTETTTEMATPLANGSYESVVDDVNIPSETGDIEGWASSYDPSIFDDADPVNEMHESARDNPPPAAAEPIEKNEDTSVLGGKTLTGSLDTFFAVEDDIFNGTYDHSVSRELRAELEVQEAHAILQRAYALKQLTALNMEWLAVGRVLSARLDEEDFGEKDKASSPHKALSPADSSIQLDSMHINDIKEHCNTLATRLRDVSNRAHNLDISAKRITSRLMDYSSADGIEGRLSVAQQEELASMVDDHLESLLKNWRAPAVSAEANRFHNNRDPVSGWGDENGLERNESFDEDVARINDDWGEWADDDFTWSPEGNLDYSIVTRSSNGAKNNIMESRFDNFEVEAQILENEESLEAALHRIDTEWGEWARDDPPLPAIHVSESDEFAHSEYSNEVKAVDNESALDDDSFVPAYDEPVGIPEPGCGSVFE